MTATPSPAPIPLTSPAKRREGDHRPRPQAEEPVVEGAGQRTASDSAHSPTLRRPAKRQALRAQGALSPWAANSSAQRSGQGPRPRAAAPAGGPPRPSLMRARGGASSAPLPPLKHPHLPRPLPQLHRLPALGPLGPRHGLGVVLRFQHLARGKSAVRMQSIKVVGRHAPPPRERADASTWAVAHRHLPDIPGSIDGRTV
jgi:hypothetical protein